MNILNFILASLMMWTLGGVANFSYAITYEQDSHSRLVKKIHDRYEKLSTKKKMRVMKRQMRRLNFLEKQVMKIPESTFKLLGKKKDVNHQDEKTQSVTQAFQDTFSEAEETNLENWSQDESELLYDIDETITKQIEASQTSRNKIEKKQLLQYINDAKELTKNESSRLLQELEGRNPSSGPNLLSGVGIIIIIIGLVLVVAGIVQLVLGVGFVIIAVGGGVIFLGLSLIAADMINRELQSR